MALKAASTIRISCSTLALSLYLTLLYITPNQISSPAGNPTLNPRLANHDHPILAKTTKKALNPKSPYHYTPKIIIALLLDASYAGGKTSVFLSFNLFFTDSDSITD